jgi:predicted sulfurtransferase
MLTSDGRFAYSAQSARNGEKVCAKCRRWARLADFPSNGRASTGRSSWCRECHRNAVRDWRRRNRERENARRREAYRRDMPKRRGTL